MDLVYRAKKEANSSNNNNKEAKKSDHGEKIVSFIEWPIVQKMLNYTHPFSLYIYLKAEHLKHRIEKMEAKKYGKLPFVYRYPQFI